MKIFSLFCKFSLVLCFCISFAAKAQTVNTEWATKINQTFAGIDKNKVPHSLLRDYAMEFTHCSSSAKRVYLLFLKTNPRTLTLPKYTIHKGAAFIVQNRILFS